MLARWPISVFASAFDAAPVARDVTFPDLCRALTHFDVANSDDKRNVRAWSAARYPEGAPRARANVLDVSMLVLDVDDGTPVQDVLDRFAEWPLIWHTSWSHTPDTPKFRVVLPLEELVPADGWGRCFAWAQEQSGGHIDEATKDPSRLWFRPAVRSDDWPRDCGVIDPGGRCLALDPSKLPPTPEEARAAEILRKREATKLPKDTPAWKVRREVQERLKVDPSARLTLAESVGARITGGGIRQRATGILCPQCSRPAVWFWIAPDKAAGAQCDHRNSCGWHGWLDELAGIKGVTC